MAETIQLDIVTPEKVIFSGSVEMVTAPGVLGEFGVLPGHAALVTTLETGEAKIKQDNQEKFFAISGGFAEISGNKVILLAEAAEPAQEIDVNRAEAAKAKAEETLKSLAQEDPQLKEAEEGLKRAENRIRVATQKPS